MNRQQKLDLIQRSLGLKHKLKVHESMKQPETHEDMALMYLTQWEFEDELQAIEGLLADARQQNVAEKRAKLSKHGVTKESKVDFSSSSEYALPVVQQEDDDAPASKKRKR